MKNLKNLCTWILLIATVLFIPLASPAVEIWTIRLQGQQILADGSPQQAFLESLVANDVQQFGSAIPTQHHAEIIAASGGSTGCAILQSAPLHNLTTCTPGSPSMIMQWLSSGELPH